MLASIVHSLLCPDEKDPKSNSSNSAVLFPNIAFSWGVSLLLPQKNLAMKKREQDPLPSYPLLNFNKGDIFYLKCFSLHWMLALNEKEYFKMAGYNDHTGSIVIQKMRQEEYDDSRIFKTWPAPQEIRPGVELIGQPGYDLARRLDGMLLYYDFFRCNCRHYIYHILYGTPTPFGKWWNLFNLPISAKCPLAERLTKNSKVNHPDFRLRNRLKEEIKPENDKNGQPNWIAETLRDSRASSNSHSKSDSRGYSNGSSIGRRSNRS